MSTSNGNELKSGEDYQNQKLEVPSINENLSSFSPTFPPLLNDLIIRAAKGEKIERTPIWVHRQAGRYLPEFRELRSKHDFFKICQTPHLAAEITLQPIRRFDLDAAIIFSDILVVPQCLGLEVKMMPGEGPVLPNPIKTPDQLHRLIKREDVNVKSSLGYVMDAIKLTRLGLKGKVPLIGFSGAPWTLMAYMVEGGGSKSYNHARAWFYKDPAAAHQLLSLLSSVITEYLILQVEAGAQMLEVFDSWAGDLSPDIFRKFSLPYLKAIARDVKKSLSAKGLSVPMTIFPKGAHYAIEDFVDSDYDVISVDWSIQPDSLLRLKAGRLTIQGNLDVSVLYAPANEIEKEVKKMLDGLGPNKYIANLGHGMLPDHPIEGLAQFIDTVHSYSQELLKKS